MSSTKLSLIMLVQSLVWAVVMVFAAFTLSGTSYKGPVFTCLFAGWFVSWLLPLVLMDHRKAMRAECALLGRILNLRKT